MRDGRLVAHRGYQRHYPENTLLAIRKAVEAGAAFVETDIQFSADNQPVLYHDVFMTRLSGLDEVISQKSLAELAKTPVTEPTRLAEDHGECVASLVQLVEYLESVPDVAAFIELKRQSIGLLGTDVVLDTVLRVLEPIRDRAIIISFDIEAMQAVRQRGWPQVGVVIRDWDQRNSPEVQAVVPDYQFIDINELPESGTLAIEQGKLVIYEVADPAIAQGLLARNADMIETFAIGEMITSLAN